jgi:threonine dehydrogenase-like Zn-dependent dehydrogenase
MTEVRVLEAVLVGTRHIELRERPVPALGQHDVLVQVTECGLCASEVDFWLGRSDRQMPAPLGHEAAGIVLHVGDEVGSLRPGDRVACWTDGGGFSDVLVTKESSCIAIGEDCQHPVVAEPLACIVNAVSLAAPQLGDDVVIIGAGFMGCLLQLVVQLRGPRTVTVVDIREDALQRAAALGATHTVKADSADLAALIADTTQGRGADLTFEVTGTNRGLELAETVTRMSGKLAIVGYHQGGTRSIRLGHWNWMAFSIINAHFRDQDTIMAGMRTGLRLLSAGRIDVAPLLTHRYPLQRISDAFEAATAKPPGFVKAVIHADGHISMPGSVR